MTTFGVLLAPGNVLADRQVADIQAADAEKSIQTELQFWESIKRSNRAQDYDAYLEAFPGGRFVPLAKARSNSLYRHADQRLVEQKSDLGASINKYEVVVAIANLRARPTTESPVVAKLKAGSYVRLTGQLVANNWFPVQTDAGDAGFIHSRLVRQSDEVVTKVTRSKTGPPPRGESNNETVSGRQQSAGVTPENPAEEIREITLIKDCEVCPNMVILAPGTFLMGDEGGGPSEQPVHRVSLSQPFAIGQFEITIGEWEACVAEGGCQPRANANKGPDYPVNAISWRQAQAYVQWLSEKSGQTYRLPTEAEWEYAARGGTSTRYWWGDEFRIQKANCKECGDDWEQASPAKVGSYEPNPFGLYDMAGSVWEWVSDCWHDSYFGAPDDGSSWDEEGCHAKVVRGGSWRNDAAHMRSAIRFWYDANGQYILFGFRVARTLSTHANALPTNLLPNVQRLDEARLGQKSREQPPILSFVDLVLNNRWYLNAKPAFFLPSSLTNCLKQGERKVVCFSRELERTVGDSKLTYTTKSEWSNFSADDSSFAVGYQFNVVQIDPAEDPGPLEDPDGLKAKLGWQDPGGGEVIRCRVLENKTLNCLRNNKHLATFVSK
jgi:formylglycine-generating enzyme required for sulfatase activity